MREIRLVIRSQLWPILGACQPFSIMPATIRTLLRTLFTSISPEYTRKHDIPPEYSPSFTPLPANVYSLANRYPVELALGRNIGVHINIPVAAHDSQESSPLIPAALSSLNEPVSSWWPQGLQHKRSPSQHHRRRGRFPRQCWIPVWVFVPRSLLCGVVRVFSVLDLPLIYGCLCPVWPGSPSIGVFCSGRIHRGSASG